MLLPLQDETGDPRGPAWSVERNPRCIAATLNHWCRPDRKDPAWEAERRAALGDAAFERQFGRNWSTPTGAVWYPEFAANVREVGGVHQGWYVRQARQNLTNTPFVRGFDFGQRPAMVMGQWSRQQGLLWIYRELRLEHMLVHDFFALVRFLCGEATLGELRAEKRHAALAWLEQEQRTRFYGVPLPWLPHGSGAKFIDFCANHEGRMGNCLAPSEETRTCILAAGQQRLRIRGIKTKWSDRDITMRFLLREGQIDGYPRLLIDPACKWLLRGMAGGLVRPTHSQTFGGPKRDRIYEDVHDALTYAACGMLPLHFIPALEKRAKLLKSGGGGATPASAAPGQYTRARREAPREGRSWARNVYQAGR